MTAVHTSVDGSLGTGPFPAHRRRVVALSVLCGFLLTVVWSASFVDRVIGDNVANTLLGYDAKATPVEGVLAGVLFAFVSGFAGTFTACNIAVFGAVGPLLGERRPTVRDTLTPLGWIAIGMVSVSAVYGAVVAIAGTRMPQFSTAASGGGLSPRAIQSMIAFGVVGLGFLWLGLIALGLVRNPLARHPRAPLVLMGALIGGLLVGRPFALFRVMFRDSAQSHDVVYAVASFVLQSVGNIVVMALLFLLLAHGTGGRLQHWLAAKPARLSLVTGAGLLVAGTFTLLYWDVRVLARAGVLWYPMIGW